MNTVLNKTDPRRPLPKTDTKSWSLLFFIILFVTPLQNGYMQHAGPNGVLRERLTLTAFLKFQLEPFCTYRYEVKCSSSCIIRTPRSENVYSASEKKQVILWKLIFTQGMKWSDVHPVNEDQERSQDMEA